MTLPKHDGRRLPSSALALAFGVLIAGVIPATANAQAIAPGPVGPQNAATCGAPGCQGHGRAGGGFQGFGLRCPLGYGYGGDALGVGPFGGYPFYGGPGYPHAEPQLRRLGRIVPFPYFGGPGAPCPGQPNFFGGVGPLAVDPPVLTLEADAAYGPSTDYGPYTGEVPYPDSVFAPFTTASTTTSAHDPIIPATVEVSRAAAHRRPQLGLDADPVVDAGGGRGLRITKVFPGSAAEKAGLRPGDVIRSIDGYRTEQPDHVVWILTNAAPGKVVAMTVRSARDGKEIIVKAALR